MFFHCHKLYVLFKRTLSVKAFITIIDHLCYSSKIINKMEKKINYRKMPWVKTNYIG